MFQTQLKTKSQLDLSERDGGLISNVSLLVVSGGLAFFVRGGQQQNSAPSNQTSSLTRLAALAIFPTFVMVLFDTLTWSRAECRHLIDLGERGGLGAKQPPGKFFVTMPFKLLENKGLVLSDVFWCRKTFLPTFYILCTKKRYFTSASIFSNRSCFIDTLFFWIKLGLTLGYGFCIRVQVYDVAT